MLRRIAWEMKRQTVEETEESICDHFVKKIQVLGMSQLIEVMKECR